MPRTSRAEGKLAFESEIFTSRRAGLGDFTAATLAVLEGNLAAARGQS